MFEQLRQSLDDLLARATKPEERRTIVARMKSTVVQATLGVDELRDALARSRRQLEAERRELETVRRRKQLALTVNDTETVTIAERFEQQHQARAQVVEEKIAVQEREVDLAERELGEMKAELRQAMAGTPLGAGAAGSGEDVPDASGGERDAAQSEIDSLARARAREERDADAERRLEELKKKMGR